MSTARDSKKRNKLAVTTTSVCWLRELLSQGHGVGVEEGREEEIKRVEKMKRSE